MYFNLYIKRGFSLVELMVVVLVIAILAAIAIPNFLNAQIRAKISRAQADMKVVQTASRLFLQDKSIKTLVFLNCNSYKLLTTPINYLSSINSARDIFGFPRMEEEIYKEKECYVYSNTEHLFNTIPKVINTKSGKIEYLFSIGPDLKRGRYVLNLPFNNHDSVYNSSNGLISFGDLHLEWSK